MVRRAASGSALFAVLREFMPPRMNKALRIRGFLSELCRNLTPDFIVIGGWAG